jgi:hypothetical protein
MTDHDLVTVYVPEEPSQLALVESILDEHGIPYAAKNSELQNLFGAGEIGAYNLAVGPVAIQVEAADLERSRQLIAEALGDEAARSTGLEDEADDSAAPSPADERAARYARYSLVWAVLWFGGVGSLLGIYFGLKALSLGREAPAFTRRKAKIGIAFGVAGVILWFLTWGSALIGLQL